MNASERSSHPSSAQIEALIDYLERNPDLAKGFSKCQNARERNRRQWEQLTVTLNSMGGTIKTVKQWTKYWTDKKSAIKKKVAARAAARRRTGGGLDDIVELSEVEERIVALFGGEGFGTGDTHLGIQLFPEYVTSEPLPSTSEIEIQRIDYSNAYNIQQQQRSSVEATNMVSVPEHNRQIARRLFVSSDDIFASAPSQSILHDMHRESYSSPPPPTLSQTPSPLPFVSPSRRGVTATNSSNMVRANAGSASSHRAQPPTPQLSAHTLTSEASPSRRGAATGTNTNRSHIRTTSTTHTRRSAAASSRSTRSAAAASPPSQRRTEFSRITDRFLRIEEQQLEIQQSNARILQTMMEHSVERERVLAEAVAAIGQGLKALAEATKPNL